MTSFSSIQQLDDHLFSFHDLPRFIVRWTPRAAVAGLAGFYSLGYAYEIGLMAAVDRVAIRVLRHHVGYVGLGAIMPTFQWYSAWSIRLTSAVLAGFIYDTAERICFCTLTFFSHALPTAELEPVAEQAPSSPLKVLPIYV